jgi:uncharacterized protein YxeA
MKKVFTVIGVILMVVLTVAVAVGVLVYTGVIGKETLNKESVYIYTTEDGCKYTEAEWDWKPVEYKKLINYVDTTGVATQTISLYLEDDVYYNVTVPVTDYIYDYGKTVWAVDGSYMIRVISGASLDNLSSLAGIDNGQALNQTTLCTQDSRKGQKTIVTLIDSYAIIANVYYGDDTYSIIRNSLSSENSSYVFDVSYADDYVELEKLSYVGEYVGQVVFQDVSLEQQKYMFADGVLWSSSVFEPLYKTKELYLERICAASGQGIDETYSTDGMFYAKSGNYYLGLVSYNSNTTIVFLGDGEETKCNIISVMHYLR